MVVHPLLAYLRGRAGPALRVVASYTPDGADGLYFRDDLDPEGAITRMQILSERLDRDAVDADTLPLHSLGTETAIIHVWDDVLLLHFPCEDAQGILVSLESGEIADLDAFIRACTDRLDTRLLPP